MKNQEIRDAQALPIKPNMGINETFRMTVMIAPDTLIIAPILVLSVSLYQTERLKNIPIKRPEPSNTGTMINPSK